MEFNKKGILGRAKAVNQETAAVMDEGLRAYMLKVYNYMATGILLTGIVALVTFKMSVVTNNAGSIVGLTQVGYAMIIMIVVMVLMNQKQQVVVVLLMMVVMVEMVHV